MTREEGPRSQTVDCACPASQEDILESLMRGKLTDFTVWSKDMMAVPADETLSAEEICTTAGGKVMDKK